MFCYFLLPFSDVIFHLLQGHSDANNELSIDVVLISFCYMYVYVKDRQFDQMISMEVPICFASNAMFSF
jgi:hypothetical protein